MDEEIYRIVLQARGEDEAKKLADQAKRLEADIKSLQSSFAAGNVHFATYRKELADLTQAKARLGKQIRDITDEFGKANTGFRLSGQAMGQLAYIADDVQYGWQGIINNVQPLIGSLGVGAGLAGTLAIVSIAGVQLYNHFGDLMDIMGLGKTKTEAEQMEALADATHRTAEETARLNRYKTEQSVIQQQAQGRSDAESSMTTGVNNAVANAGRDDLVRALVQLNRGRYENAPDMSDLVRRRDLAAGIASAPVGFNESPQEIAFRAKRRAEAAKLQEEIDTKVNAAAAADLAKAALDPGRLQGLLNQVISNPAVFGPNAMKFAQGLMAASPEYTDAQIENEKAVKRAQDRKANQEKDRKQKDEEAEYEWQKLTDSNASWKAYKAKQDQLAARQRAQQQDQEQWTNAPMMGAGGGLRDLMVNAMRLGGNPNAIAGRAFGNMIAQRGVGVQDARRMVDDAMFEARMARSQELLDRALPSDIRNSQVIAASSLASQIQSSISNKDDPRRILNETIKQSYLLGMILQETRRRQGLNFR